MSHQPLDVEMVSIQRRFNIAMKLRERPPADFLATAGLDIHGPLLAMTDHFGANALHWAAKHWSIGHRRSWPSSRLALYGDFIISLIRAGIPISALDRNCHSPFMHLLDCPLDDWSHIIWHIPNEVHPGQIITSWGALLRKAGILLSKYVGKENELLSRLEGRHSPECIWRGKLMELRSVSLSDQMTFTMRVNTLEHYEHWEIRPPPGSYMDITREPRRLP